MSNISIHGRAVGYDDQGGGDVLLLIHGHPFNRTMWRPQIETLRRSRWRVITPDLRGYGESAPTPGPTTLTAFAEDIAGLLDLFGIQRVVLGGLSMGGQIVLEFYRLFPHRVRALLLADTFAQADSEDGKKARRDTADRLEREGMSAYAEEVLPKMLAPHNITAHPEVAKLVLGMMQNTSPAGAASALRGRAERSDYTELLPNISVPALVVVGREDEFTPVSQAQFMHDRIPDSRLAIIEGAGHMPNLEKPAEFNMALRSFLDEIYKASTSAA